MVRSHRGVVSPRDRTPAADSYESDVLYFAGYNLNLTAIERSEEELLTGCSKFDKRQILRDLNTQVRMNRLQRVNQRGTVFYAPVLGGEVR